MKHRNLYSDGQTQCTAEEGTNQQQPAPQCSDLHLTEAVRPNGRHTRLVEGYRQNMYRGKLGHIPVITASVTREKLFDFFMECTDLLGTEVDVILETSHPPNTYDHHRDLHRGNIDLPVLQSALYEHERLFMDDGCAGIAVMNPQSAQEVQFDEHKLIIVFAHKLAQYQELLQRYCIAYRERIRFITETGHMHISHEQYQREFDTLAQQLGCEEI